MDNYGATVDPQRPLGYRHLRPAETLAVDDIRVRLRGLFVPARVSFRYGVHGWLASGCGWRLLNSRVDPPAPQSDPRVVTFHAWADDTAPP
jgi:hypothetical protein